MNFYLTRIVCIIAGVFFAIRCQAQTNTEVQWGYSSNLLGSGLSAGLIRPVRIPTNGHLSGIFTNTSNNPQGGSVPSLPERLLPPTASTRPPIVSIPANLVPAPIETNVSSFTNGPVGRENYLPTTTKSYEQALANPNLDPNMRRAYELLLQDSQEKQADFQQNSQLWANLFDARKSGNPAEVKRAEQELANYLATFSDKNLGKKYSAGTSLETILEDYTRRAGTNVPAHPRSAPRGKN